MGRKRLPSPEEISNTEDNLHEALWMALNAYRQARDETTKLHQITKDVGLDNPDGMVALFKANRLEREALQRYLAAMKAFNDFILHRKLPPGLP
jgi:hypothetical protein